MEGLRYFQTSYGGNLLILDDGEPLRRSYCSFMICFQTTNPKDNMEAQFSPAVTNDWVVEFGGQQ